MFYCMFYFTCDRTLSSAVRLKASDRLADGKSQMPEVEEMRDRDVV